MAIRYNIYKDEINHRDFFRSSCPLFHGITLIYFYAFNTQSKADHAKNISELAKYGQPKQDILKVTQIMFFQLLMNSNV